MVGSVSALSPGDPLEQVLAALRTLWRQAVSPRLEILSPLAPVRQARLASLRSRALLELRASPLRSRPLAPLSPALELVAFCASVRPLVKSSSD
jgi:hypothetical protein